tara:strand:- start:21014 stop:22987 length:1974 start_codon:yes stop_codon:yes gene_type:complete
MLRARAGWGFVAAGGSPPQRSDKDDAPFDVVGATGTFTGRPSFRLSNVETLTLEGVKLVNDASTMASTTFRGTAQTLTSPSSTSGSPGVTHKLSVRARKELANDLRDVHQRLNESTSAKLASDKLHKYFEARRLKTEMVANQNGARLAMPKSNRVDNDTCCHAIRVAAARALAAGVRRATPQCAEELKLGNHKRAEEKTRPDGRRKQNAFGVGQRPPKPTLPNFLMGSTAAFTNRGFGGRPPPSMKGRAVLGDMTNRTHRTESHGANTLSSENSTKSFASSSRSTETTSESLCVKGESSVVWSLARDAFGTAVGHGHSQLKNKDKENTARLSLSGELSDDEIHSMLPTLAGGLGGFDRHGLSGDTGVLVSKPPSPYQAIPTLNRKIPNFDDDEGYEFSDARGAFNFNDEKDDDNTNSNFELFKTACDTLSDHDSVDYDFPSPASSAAAAYIGAGLSRTSLVGSSGFATPGGKNFSESPATIAFAGFTPASEFITPTEGDYDKFERFGGTPINRTTVRLDQRATANMAALTFGAGGFGTGFAIEKEKENSESLQESSYDSEDSQFDSFDGFDGIKTPGLPDFTPTKCVETPGTETRTRSSANSNIAPSPRTAAINLETEQGMATRIQAAFRGMLGRIEARGRKAVRYRSGDLVFVLRI